MFIIIIIFTITISIIVNVIILLLQVLINIFNIVTTNSPNVEGMTAIAAWMLVCIFFVFFALVGFVIVNLIIIVIMIALVGFVIIVMSSTIIVIFFAPARFVIVDFVQG